MRVLFTALLLLSSALAGGGEGTWRSLTPAGTWTASPARRAPPPCPALTLPPDWEVRSSVLADVTGDGIPECVLAVWRPWRDWRTARWTAHPTPIQGNRDARGLSSHVAVLRPLGGGRYREVWVGSALFQPVAALTVLPGGTLATLETTYAAPGAPARALSLWHWTGFGFRLDRRALTVAREVQPDAQGRPAVR
ncbi:hypothetical protein GCM10008959_18580 [Deinococcus seoulensis]|uniref:Uncharacterized protein n=1 Tax=Deinococcus seoulensis TaxID=1837379 RepID=A0ABQ2RUA5_9DEIO|nr:hypothetical protein [Deinococcus seoulensis]GGR57173.1 hypothetical protein GCM10008959_18580 [Deinococcus seoulensis]